MYCGNVVSLHRKQKNKPINRAATYKRQNKNEDKRLSNGNRQNR